MLRRTGPAAEVGGHPFDETRLTLAIHGLDLNPREITALLEREPTSAHQRGEQRGNNMEPWAQGAWILSMGAGAPRRIASIGAEVGISVYAEVGDSSE